MKWAPIHAFEVDLNQLEYIIKKKRSSNFLFYQMWPYGDFKVDTSF